MSLYDKKQNNKKGEHEVIYDCYPEEDVKEFIKKRLKDLADVNSGKLHPMVAFNRLRHEAGKGLIEEKQT